MQKNNTKSVWNVKNLVFMALLVAMQLVFTRVLVLERLCGESVYYTGIHSLGRSSGPFQKILFKQIQKGEDRGDFGFYCHYRSDQLSVPDNGRTGDYAWI